MGLGHLAARRCPGTEARVRSGVGSAGWRLDAVIRQLEHPDRLKAELEPRCSLSGERAAGCGPRV